MESRSFVSLNQKVGERRSLDKGETRGWEILIHSPHIELVNHQLLIEVKQEMKNSGNFPLR
jgi:hypothetical protein